MNFVEKLISYSKQKLVSRLVCWFELIWSIGVHIGNSLPTPNWSKVRFIPNINNQVDLFQMNFVEAADSYINRH